VRDRSELLASAIDQQTEEVAQFLAGRSDSDLALPCEDPSGATVAAGLSHLTEGYELVLPWLVQVTAGPVAAPPGAAAAIPGGQPPSSGTVRSYAESLRRGGQGWADLVRGLSAAQLEQVPPATKDITDGSVPLADVIDRMIRHQAAHLAYLRSAVAAPELTA
jgi:hypothetical protein